VRPHLPAVEGHTSLAPSSQPQPTASGVVGSALHAIPTTFCLTRCLDQHSTAAALVQTARWNNGRRSAWPSPHRGVFHRNGEGLLWECV